MRSCPSCGGSAPPAAGWCGQCFAPLPAVDEPVAAAEPLALVGAQPAPLTRFWLPETPQVDPLTLGDAAPTAAVAVSPKPATPMLSGKALALVAIAIGIGIVGSAVSWALAQNERMEPETYIRYAIVITVAVYALVGGLTVTRLTPGVFLRWHHGKPAQSILIGALVGASLGFGLVWLSSTANGHLSSDLRIVTIMSEGDFAHIVVGVGIAVVCAPLVEEVLFRGLLLESFRARALALGVVTSAAAFALWHLNFSVVPLVYYSLMGCVLAAVYLKRGLAGSVAAHAGFNGVLTVAALAIVLAPSTKLTSGDISITAAGGWTKHLGTNARLVLLGPSGSRLQILEESTYASPSVSTILARIQAGVGSDPAQDAVIDASTAHAVRLPAGRAVEVEATDRGHAATIVLLPRPGMVVEVDFYSSGSVKARADFSKMLRSLRVG